MAGEGTVGRARVLRGRLIKYANVSSAVATNFIADPIACCRSCFKKILINNRKPQQEQQEQWETNLVQTRARTRYAPHPPPPSPPATFGALARFFQVGVALLRAT